MSFTKITHSPDFIQFKWNKDANVRFKSAIETTDVKEDLKSLCQPDCDRTIDEKIQVVTDILLSAAKK